MSVVVEQGESSHADPIVGDDDDCAVGEVVGDVVEVLEHDVAWERASGIHRVRNRMADGDVLCVRARSAPKSVSPVITIRCS